MPLKIKQPPTEKNIDAMIGTIQCTLAKLPVHPNQNSDIGSANAPTSVGGSCCSGAMFQFASKCRTWYFAFQKKYPIIVGNVPTRIPRKASPVSPALKP